MNVLPLGSINPPLTQPEAPLVDAGAAFSALIAADGTPPQPAGSAISVTVPTVQVPAVPVLAAMPTPPAGSAGPDIVQPAQVSAVPVAPPQEPKVSAVVDLARAAATAVGVMSAPGAGDVLAPETADAPPPAVLPRPVPAEPPPRPEAAAPRRKAERKDGDPGEMERQGETERQEPFRVSTEAEETVAAEKPETADQAVSLDGHAVRRDISSINQPRTPPETAVLKSEGMPSTHNRDAGEGARIPAGTGQRRVKAVPDEAQDLDQLYRGVANDAPAVPQSGVFAPPSDPRMGTLVEDSDPRIKGEGVPKEGKIVSTGDHNVSDPVFASSDSFISEPSAEAGTRGPARGGEGPHDAQRTHATDHPAPSREASEGGAAATIPPQIVASAATKSATIGLPHPQNHPLTPHLPVRAGRFGGDLGVEITRRIVTGHSETVIRLDPLDMGRIDIRMSLDADSSVKLLVSADNPTVLDMIRREAGDLMRALSDAGLRADSQSLRFGSQGSSSGQQWQGSGQGGEERRGRQPYPWFEEQPSATYRHAIAGGQVDLMA